jgi:NADPH2:quinone reductase
MSSSITRAVRYDRFGGRDVLYLADIPTAQPSAGEVLVEIKAAGINPGEANIRSGVLQSMFPSTFPSGQGSDLAGVVVAVGDGVTEFAVGDEVLGFSHARSSHATHSVVPVSQLIAKPTGLSWEVAGSLYVAGVTAFAAVRASGAVAGETVVVAAAAGGVGSIAVQLLVGRGVTVLGIASQANAEWLRAHGVVPIAYGEGLAERLTAAAPNGIDAFIDLFGPEYLDLALELGIDPQRIETIISFQRAAEIGAKAEGSGTASTTEVLDYLVARIWDGTVEVEIAKTFPLDEVAAAFELLEQHHTRGKIVLIP